jgi:hypothetical protein
MRTYITEFGITTLADFGFPVTSSTAKRLSEYLAAFEAVNLQKLPRARVSGHMGWLDGTKRGFLSGRTLITADGSEAAEVDLEAIAPEDWREDWIAFRGADEGDEQIADAFEPAGSLDEWTRAFQLARLYPRVMVMLYASLSAPLLEIVGCPSYVVDLAFVTSKGKTIALRLAASCWGNPNEAAEASAVASWNATAVWLERAASLLHGMPLCVDDTKKARYPTEIAKVIYNYTGNRGRNRGSRKGLARTGSHTGVLLSTGEARITSFTKDGGTVTRTICLWGMPFDRADEETARLVAEINQTVIDNHGHVGPAFARALLKNRDRWGEYRECYRAHVRRLSNEVLDEGTGYDSAAGRLAQYGAAIAFTIELAAELIGLQSPDENPVDALWNEITGQATEADRARQALEAVVGWATAHATHFYGRHRLDREGEALQPSTGWLGRWDRGKGSQFLAIYPTVLDARLRDWGFDSDAVVKSWKDRDWLLLDDDRHLDCKVRLNGTQPRLVKIARPAVELAGGGYCDEDC